MCYGSILRIFRPPLPTVVTRLLRRVADAVLLLVRLGVLTSCGISWLPLLLSPPLVVVLLLGVVAAPFCRRRFSTNRRPVITLVPPLVVVVTVGVPAFTAVGVCSSSAVGSTSISVLALSSCCGRERAGISWEFKLMIASIVAYRITCMVLLIVPVFLFKLGTLLLLGILH